MHDEWWMLNETYHQHMSHFLTHLFHLLLHSFIYSFIPPHNKSLCIWKTTLARSVYNALNQSNNVAYLIHDNYYKNLSDHTFEERAKQNFDHPDRWGNEDDGFIIDESMVNLMFLFFLSLMFLFFLSILTIVCLFYCLFSIYLLTYPSHGTIW